jgi:creatinine amidohydrolase
MAHACEFETSIYLHLKPELVEKDKMATETPSKLSKFMYSDLFGDSPVHFVNRYSRTARSGVEGDPFKATSEKGKRIVEAEITNLIEFARNFRDLPDLPDMNFNYQKPV